MAVVRVFEVGANSGLFHKMAKKIFPEGNTSAIFLSPTPKLSEKHFFTQGSKFQSPGSVPTPNAQSGSADSNIKGSCSMTVWLKMKLRLV